MPWTVADVDRHKEGLTDKQKETWIKVANDARKRCIDKGGSEKECDASAIKQANSVVGEQQEADVEPGGPDKCVCPDCDYETEKKRGIPCRQMKCPECGANLVASGEEQQQEEAGMDGADVMTVDVDGERVPLSDLIEAYRQMSEATMKTVDGKKYPASDFLVVEDAQKPSTWHLQVKRNGKPDHGLMGGAWAALMAPGGHRGNKYAGPGKSAAIGKLRALYKSEDMETPGQASEADLDGAISPVMVRSVLRHLLDQFEESASEVAEAELAESASGAAIGLVEAETAASGPRAPLLLDVALIRPGWGNSKDRHYYSREMLARDAKVFEGVKMYATDHRAGEKSVRTEVSQIQQITGFTADGAPIARVAVHDPDFAEATRNRAQLGTLGSLECSILATGRTRPGEMDGKKGNVVEAITSAQSVDWVTKAGAGGRALNLAESDGGDNMSEQEQQDVKPEKQEHIEEQQEVHLLSEAEVSAVLDETKLPDVSKKRLADAKYADAKQVTEAVGREVAYLKEVTGSGKPFAQGGGNAPQETVVSEADVQKRLDAIDRRHGLYIREVSDD